MLMRSINLVTRMPSFGKVTHQSNSVSELLDDLIKIQSDENTKTGLYEISKKYFKESPLLTTLWPDSMFSANSNMLVFYSSKSRYYLVNLMIMEPLINNLQNRGMFLEAGGIEQVM